MERYEQLHVRDELKARRARLVRAARTLTPPPPELNSLLAEVDHALQRIDDGVYGLCATCHDTIEPERLRADPLLQYCLDHLTPVEQKSLELDIELARRVQQRLLPNRDRMVDGWQVGYRYEAAGPVSGDYCDLVPTNGAPGDFYFALGDVAGKGIAAAMMMAHLNATFRALAPLALPIAELVARVNVVFCESALEAGYATLACGRVGADGIVEHCNAGHCEALVVRRSGVESLPGNGIPVGLFCATTYGSSSVRLEPGESLLLHTDGVTDTRNTAGDEYGAERLRAIVARNLAESPDAVTAAVMHDVAAFRGGAPRTDDLTVMVIQRRS